MRKRRGHLGAAADGREHLIHYLDGGVYNCALPDRRDARLAANLLRPAFRDAGVQSGRFINTRQDTCRLVDQVVEQIKDASKGQIKQYWKHANKIVNEE